MKKAILNNPRLFNEYMQEKAYTDRNAPTGWTWGCAVMHKHVRR